VKEVDYFFLLVYILIYGAWWKNQSLCENCVAIENPVIKEELTCNAKTQY
jgi:hypothetical protein